MNTHSTPTKSDSAKSRVLSKTWPRNPVIYEINTWVWLHELSDKYGKQITLGNVPEEEYKSISAYQPDAVWFMGVWERSPEGTRIAREEPGLIQEYRNVLGDWSSKDTVGSPYCIHRYVVDQHLGGPAGLATARGALAAQGMRLLLDFVPNHVAPDHPWISEHPEYFIQGQEADLADPQSYFKAGTAVLAHGRDPNFAAWTDTVQVNAFNPGLRQAVLKTLQDIGDQCDGVRCDMAMLLTNQVFQRTWGQRGGQPLPVQYWTELIAAVHKKHPDMIFVAEVYWDMEWDLQQQGFDYCYDKRLYDRMLKEGAQSVLSHLSGDINYQKKLLRFIENHDEKRASSVFEPSKLRAAATVCATLPGGKLYYDGQFAGRKAKLPVQLGRAPAEPVDQELQKFYARLLAVTTNDTFHNGAWQICRTTGWPDNNSHENLVAWCWKKDDDRYLVVVNLSDRSAQGHVPVPWNDIDDREFSLKEQLGSGSFERSGYEMRNSGLFVNLPPWKSHFLKFCPEEA